MHQDRDQQRTRPLVRERQEQRENKERKQSGQAEVNHGKHPGDYGRGDQGMREPFQGRVEKASKDHLFGHRRKDARTEEEHQTSAPILDVLQLLDLLLQIRTTHQLRQPIHPPLMNPHDHQGNDHRGDAGLPTQAPPVQVSQAEQVQEIAVAGDEIAAQPQSDKHGVAQGPKRIRMPDHQVKEEDQPDRNSELHPAKCRHGHPAQASRGDPIRIAPGEHSRQQTYAHEDDRKVRGIDQHLFLGQ